MASGRRRSGGPCSRRRGLLLSKQVFLDQKTAECAFTLPFRCWLLIFRTILLTRLFDGTLEPMFNVALEGASFINAYSRGNARS